jgi:2,4-dienoyl-CoA reductase-like NADH-dependent reductase (Old Yellow Enzyme family)
MEQLAKPIGIRGATIKNRLSTLPMESNDATPDGRPSERTIERYKTLAAGGWGTIYVEAISPGERGKSRPAQLVLNEKNLDSFRRLADEIHAAADPPPFVIFQINHGGRYAIRTMFAYHSALLDPTWNIAPDSPPASTGEIENAASSSAAAVRLAALAGADAADLKCCHGYLAAELFRPANTRTDKFGTTYENRTRYFRTMLDAAAAAAKDNGLIFGARISLHERIPGGIGSAGADGLRFDPSELAPFVSELRDSGGSFVCETMGVPYLDPFVVRPHAGQENREEILKSHHEMAAWVKTGFPSLVTIGAGYSPIGPDFIRIAEKNISEGRVDVIGLGRQSFADPDTPKKLFNGDAAAVRWCKCCKRNNCSTLLLGRVPVGCVIYDSFYSRQLEKLKQSGTK